MAKPPTDADPQKFIIGDGVYSNLQTAQPYDDDDVFRIDPRPMPVWSIVAYNIVFSAFFFGFHWVLKHQTHGQAEPWAVYGIPIAIGGLTCVVFTLIVWCSIRKAQRLGPWLIYEKATGRIVLPREGVSFEREEIVHVQYITTKRLGLRHTMNNMRLSELNLITCRNDERKRWPLLRSIINVKAYDRLLKPLIESTDLPVMRVTDGWFGWKITERPYGAAARSLVS